MEHQYPPPVLYIEMAVPTWPCNFRCHYCYIGQYASDKERGQIDRFEYSPAEVAEALSTERLSGPAIINFCANGETLILPQVLNYIEAILDAGHYVLIVSNMTQTKAINRLMQRPPEQLQRLFFKCSFHWLELHRLKLMDAFVSNVNRIWEAGASITVEITPSDELEPYIPEIMEFSRAHFGALPHITIPRDERHNFRLLTQHTTEEFIRIWSVFESELLDFKATIWGRRITEPCYTGTWNYSVNLANGAVCRCSSHNKIGNIFPVDKPFPTAPPTVCRYPHCYNGHSWLCYGSVPTLDTPCHTSLRDRVRPDGRHWVHDTMRRAFMLRATDHHTPYTAEELRRMGYGRRRLELKKFLCRLAISVVPSRAWRRRLRKKFL